MKDMKSMKNNSPFMSFMLFMVKNHTPAAWWLFLGSPAACISPFS